jgi:hypothetical protein
MRLRPNELCPIHRSVSCCGREVSTKPKLIRLGVQRIEDSHHPRAYRELRSPAEMRKLLKRKIVEQDGICDNLQGRIHRGFQLYAQPLDYPTCAIRKERSADCLSVAGQHFSTHYQMATLRHLRHYHNFRIPTS